MFNKKEVKNPNPRMEKFLFYSKFVLLVIVIVLFTIFYSYTQKELPESTATASFPEGYAGFKHTAKVLIVLDYSEYSDNSYTAFTNLSSLLNTMPKIDYDLILVDNNDPNTLESIDESLIVRVYQNKDYDFILAVGEHSITYAEEIKKLFFPSSELMMYGVSKNTIMEHIAPVTSVTTNVVNTINAAVKINPYTEKLIFLCSEIDYCYVMMHIIEENSKEFKNIEYEVLYSDDFTPGQASRHILDSDKTTAVFYVSYLLFDSEYNHSQVIDIFRNNLSQPIYNLSPIENDKNIINSIRFWDTESSEKPLAHLGITPSHKNAENLELIERAVKSIASNKEYASSSAFLQEYLQCICTNDFPSNAQSQYDYCVNSDLLITKDELITGDIIFTGSLNNIEDVYIYVNTDIILKVNEKGRPVFTKPESPKQEAAYARPYVFD